MGLVKLEEKKTRTMRLSGAEKGKLKLKLVVDALFVGTQRSSLLLSAVFSRENQLIVDVYNLNYCTIK